MAEYTKEELDSIKEKLGEIHGLEFAHEQCNEMQKQIANRIQILSNEIGEIVTNRGAEE